MHVACSNCRWGWVVAVPCFENAVLCYCKRAVLSPERGISKEGSSSLRLFERITVVKQIFWSRGIYWNYKIIIIKVIVYEERLQEVTLCFTAAKKNWVLQRPFLSMAVTFQVTERWGFLTNLLQTTQTYLQPTKNNQTHKATSPCCFYCHIVAILVPQHSSNLLVGDTLHAPYRAF